MDVPSLEQIADLPLEHKKTFQQLFFFCSHLRSNTSNMPGNRVRSLKDVNWQSSTDFNGYLGLHHLEGSLRIFAHLQAQTSLFLII